MHSIKLLRDPTHRTSIASATLCSQSRCFDERLCSFYGFILFLFPSNIEGCVFLFVHYALPWTETNRTTRTQLALCVFLKWIRTAFTLMDIFSTCMWCSRRTKKSSFLHWNKYPLLCSLCRICLTCSIIFFTVKCTTTQRNKNIHNLLLTWKVYLKMGDGYYLWVSCVEEPS